MQPELNVFSLIAEATFLVQFVILVLILASVISWTFIIARYRDFKNIQQEADRFEQRFGPM